MRTRAQKLLQRPFLFLSILLTVAVWIILIFQIPLFQNLPNWFWPLTTLDVPHYAWIIPILSLNIGVLALIFRFPVARIRNLILLILVGYATQHMFALVQGKGLDGIRDRAVSTGHADFVYDAANPPSISRTLRDYRTMIETKELQSYPHSTKPPGHFLVYLLSSRLASLLHWSSPDPFERLATFVAFFFPLLTYLPLIPLYALARLYLPQKQSYLPLFLFISAPNINLITLHLDQSLYPLLFILSLTLFLFGRHRSQSYLFLLTGISVAGALYVSYSLSPVVACIVLIALLTMWTEEGSFAQRAWREIKNLLLVGVGFLVVELILFGLYRYNLFTDYLYVVSRHQAWKITTWTPSLYLSVGALDMLEYALWIGFPLFLFAVSWMAKSLGKWRKGDLYTLALSVFISLLFLAFFGKTVAETGRLWLFLLPCLALFAAQDFDERFSSSYKNVFTLIFGMQLFSTLFIKLFQDFY